MKNWIDLLEPILGEVMAFLVALLIAWLKKRSDKATIKNKVAEFLSKRAVSSDVSEKVIKIIDTQKNLKDE